MDKRERLVSMLKVKMEKYCWKKGRPNRHQEYVETLHKGEELDKRL